MPSLLDSFIAQGRLPSGRELLNKRAEMRGLLDGAPTPNQAPDIFNPNAGRANLQQLQGTAQAVSGAQPVPQEQLQGTAQDVADRAKRQSAAEMAQGIMAVNNGELPPSGEKYIREVVEDNVRSGPGKPGRGWLGRLFAGEKVPGISEASNKRLLSQALTTAGLAMLGAPRGSTFGQALAGGILMARTQVTETAGELLDEQRRQKRLLGRYQVLSNTDLTELERWQEVRRRSMAEGDMDAAEAAQDVIQDLKDRVAGEGERKFQVVNGQGVWVDQDAGKVFSLDGRELEQVPQEQREPVRGTVTKINGRRALINPNTGQVIRDLGPAETDDDDGETFKRTDKLADDFRSETGNLQESLLLAEQAAGAPEQDPAAQQTLVIALNKLLDPGSVVRQSEFARVQEIGGFQAEAQTFANRLAKEGQLPLEIEQKLRNEIARLQEQNEQQLQGIAEQYRERAREFGVNPDFVVRQGLLPEVSGGSPAGGRPVGSDVDSIIAETFGAGGS